MEARPVQINGIRFRSTLEARWYIFFKEFGVTLYEPQTFEFDIPWIDTDANRRYNKLVYTPDFYLPASNFLVEVKPQRQLTDAEKFKYWTFTEQTGERLVIITHGCYPPKSSECHGITIPNQELFWFGERRGKLQLINIRWYRTKKYLYRNTRTKKLRKAYDAVFATPFDKYRVR